MASGSGSNFENIVSACQSGEINAQVIQLIASTSRAFAIERARRLNIEHQVILNPKSVEIAIDKFKPDFIVLAGYLKKLSDGLVQKYPKQILNIHPSLLPKFGGHGMYGHHVLNAILNSKQSHSGATVHWVNENFDEGPIYAQESFALSANENLESLRNKTAEVEQRLYIRVLKEVCA